MTRRIPLFSALCLLLAAGAVGAQDGPAHDYFTTSDGVKIHYLTQGRGTPVILIHGYTGSAEGNWFRNGIAQALARNHRVVALDCRNHGKSDKPQPNGPGRAEDVIELMDHLKIPKAHFHGYSMGGGIVAQLLAKIPDRFLTAGFGGSGIPEVDPEWRDKVPPDKQGRDPQEDEASRLLRIRRAMDLGMSREEAEKQAATPRPAVPAKPATARPAGPKLDLTKITFPVLAINGEFDRPNAKTHRMWRELRHFTNVVLPGKSHLTAIAAPYMPKEYLESVVAFINAHDPKETASTAAAPGIPPDQPVAHFHHLHLNSRDPAASVDFYTSRFDCEKARFGGADAVWAQKSWLLFTKVEQAPPWELTSAIWHFGWGAEDMKATYQKQLDRKTKFFTPLTQLGAGFYYAYVEGPDHELIELNTANHHHFGHLHLFSEDPVSAGEWYMKYFGAKRRGNATAPPSREPRFVNGFQIGPSMSLMLDNVNIIIYPVQYSKKAYPDHWKGQTAMSSTQGRVVDHVGVSFEDLPAALERLRKDGVKVTEEMRPLAGGKGKSAFIEGPDRIRIELVEGQARKE